MAKYKRRAEAPHGVKLLLLGTLSMAITFSALSLIFSFIAYTTVDPLSFLGIFGIAALMITAAATGFSEARLGGEGAFLTTVLSSLLFVLLLLLIGLISGGGAVPIGCIINYLCFLALASLSALLGKKIRDGRGRYR